MYTWHQISHLGFTGFLFLSLFAGFLALYSSVFMFLLDNVCNAVKHSVLACTPVNLYKRTEMNLDLLQNGCCKHFVVHVHVEMLHKIGGAKKLDPFHSFYNPSFLSVCMYRMCCTLTGYKMVLPVFIKLTDFFYFFCCRLGVLLDVYGASNSLKKLSLTELL